ncbi:MAG: TldD/PmbA family protein [Anaerolineae bacterium]
MLGRERVREITEQVLAHSTADQTEVLVLGQESGLTRFANSYIHQNVAEANVEVRVRVVLDKRIGVASTNDLSSEAVQKVVETALTVARFQPQNPDFVSLPESQPIPEINAWVERTAAFTPQDRAQVVGVICRRAAEKGLVASGAFSTTSYEIAVANSLGIFAYHPLTRAHITTVIMADSSSGYASFTSLDATEIDAEALAREAVNKALQGRNPIEIEPGEYTVILEEHAVDDLLGFLAYLGFSALAVQEKRSFMGDKLGQHIVGENISIWDDGLDPRGIPMPFDFEGVRKRRVDLVVRGVARAVVYDSYTAGREPGKASTGHALPAPNTYGPMPLNMFLAPGEATKEEMLASTERGIWVTRFWYTNPVHPLKTIITGMTRDGTFLIEGGEITRPLKNLRFTQSILEALSNVEMIGRETWLERGGLGANRVPALKISKFTFTGVTEF